MKYLIGLLVTIVVIIFIIIKLLTGGGGKAPVKPADLTSYANTSTTMRWTQENAVQASQTRREIQIDVGQTQATVTVYQGYDGQILNTKSYPMDTTSYADFLHALKISAAFTKGNFDPALKNESGYCATGTRTTYEIINGQGDSIQHLWSTSCGVATYKGNVSATAELFKLQIPDYDDVIAHSGS